MASTKSCDEALTTRNLGDRPQNFLATIPEGTLLDVGDPMPKFEPWCGHAGTTTPNAEAKRLAIPLIEASADYLTMITECLLQSHGGVIRIFPAWPLDRAASFENLVAEGDVRVSAAIARGRVAVVTLARGPNCHQNVVRIMSPWTGSVETHPLPADGELRLEPTA